MQEKGTGDMSEEPSGFFLPFARRLCEKSIVILESLRGMHVLPVLRTKQQA